jgi:hypothetical protein
VPTLGLVPDLMRARVRLTTDAIDDAVAANDVWPR